MSEIVSYSNGGLQYDAQTFHWSDFWHDHYIPLHQPIYQIENNLPNKFETAFKITSKLMEKGLVKEMKVKEFVELVNSIAELI